MPTLNKLLVILLLIPITVKAEINFRNLKESCDFLNLKEECAYLSPEIPLSLLRLGNLNNHGFSFR